MKVSYLQVWGLGKKRAKAVYKGLYKELGGGGRGNDAAGAQE